MSITTLLFVISPLLITIILLKYFRFSFLIAFLVATLVAQFTVLEFDIGPASCRMYMQFGMLTLILSKILITRERIFRSKESINLFFAFTFFILWATINNFYNGETLWNIIYRFTSTHFYFFTAFTVCQFLLRKRREIVLFARVMTISSIISGFVGIMQWLGIQWFWDLAKMLHPLQVSAKISLLEMGFVPGLAQYSIPFSYHLITFGMFTFSWLFYTVSVSEKRLKMLCGLTGILILSISILISQSRSAVYASIVSIFFLLFYGSFTMIVKQGKIIKYKRKNLALIIFVLLLFFNAVILLNIQNSESSNIRYKLNRILILKHESRASVALKSINMFQKNWFFGGGLRELGKLFSVGETAIAPHNMFLNAIVYYGLPGLFFLLLLLRSVYITCKKAIRMVTHYDELRWVIYGAVAGIIAYILNSLFHNDSFITGGGFGWWLLGILCGFIAQANHVVVQKRRIKKSFSPVMVSKYKGII